MVGGVVRKRRDTTTPKLIENPRSNLHERPTEKAAGRRLRGRFWGYRCCCTPQLLRQVAVVGLLMMIVTGLILQSTTLFGNGYSSHGGIVGRRLDHWNLELYKKERMIKAKEHPVVLQFPNVQIKATRKTEKSHFDLYLSEILQRHQPNQTSVAWNGFLQSNPFVDQDPASVSSSTSVQLIKFTGATATFSLTHANALEHDLRAESCHSNWWCQRCLNSPFHGNYRSCETLCRRCYIRILSTIPGRNDPPLRIQAITEETTREKRRIPKIIHQAWHIYPRSLEYPEQARMMSTWRSQPGYEHRFYHVAQDGCSLAHEEYPEVIGKVCDMISSRIRRQKFLVLLLLYKYGGIYADGTCICVSV